MFAGIVISLYETWRRYGVKVLMIIAIPVLIGGSLYIANDTKTGMFGDRAELWKTSLKDAVKRPIIGHGLDSFRNICNEKPGMYFKNVTTNKSELLKYDIKTKSFIVKKEFAKDKDILDPWDNAHNEYVQLFFEFGAIGLIIVLLFIRNIYSRFLGAVSGIKKHIEPIMLVFTAYLIVSVGQFPLHLARTAYLIPILLGFYYKLTDQDLIKGE
jgi:O-antigen ligase